MRGRSTLIATVSLLLASCGASGSPSASSPPTTAVGAIRVDDTGALRWASGATWTPTVGREFGNVVVDRDTQGCLRAGGSPDGGPWGWYPVVLPTSFVLPALPTLLGDDGFSDGGWAATAELADRHGALPSGRCTPASGTVAVLAPEAAPRVTPQWRSPTVEAPTVLQIPGATQHCDFRSATYLRTDGGVFTRDPNRIFPDDPWFLRPDGSLRDRALVVPAPPTDAVRSDLRRADGAELFIGADAAYVAIDGVTEQWPRTEPAPFCA